MLFLKPLCHNADFPQPPYKMSADQDDSLDALGSAAQVGLERKFGRTVQRAHAGDRPSKVGKWLSWGVIVIAVVYVVPQLTSTRAFLFGVSQATKLADAEVVLEAARQAVERHRMINRSLPAQVPLAALNALVSMETTASDTYVLRFDANGIRARMDSAGNFATDAPA
jgi:hypothetical protein